MHKRLDSKALRQVMVVERANGSKELIDNQVNDDEIEQADARNKNNDWREKQIMLTCKGALTMIIYLLRSHDSLLWHIREDTANLVICKIPYTSRTSCDEECFH